jgi:hypothetical protein
MTIPRKRRPGPVPHEPSHRRAWRSLWRRCSCGLPAPCVDRLVPAPRLPFPRYGAALPPPDSSHTAEQADWFARAETPILVEPQRQSTWTGVDNPAHAPSTTSRSSPSFAETAGPGARADDKGAPHGPAPTGDLADRPNGLPQTPDPTGEPSDTPHMIRAANAVLTAEECNALHLGNEDPSVPTGGKSRPGAKAIADHPPWSIGKAVTADPPWPPSDTALDVEPLSPNSTGSRAGDIYPQRTHAGTQQVRPPAWAAPTVLLSQVGRAGGLTPAQAFRAGRGRSW